MTNTAETGEQEAARSLTCKLPKSFHGRDTLDKRNTQQSATWVSEELSSQTYPRPHGFISRSFGAGNKQRQLLESQQSENAYSQAVLSVGAAGPFGYTTSFSLHSEWTGEKRKLVTDSKTMTEQESCSTMSLKGQGVKLQQVPRASHNEGLQVIEYIPLARSSPHN
ncbi:uncharacterized [Tachysurus ichikawai]